MLQKPLMPSKLVPGLCCGCSTTNAGLQSRIVFEGHWRARTSTPSLLQQLWNERLDASEASHASQTCAKEKKRKNREEDVLQQCAEKCMMKGEEVVCCTQSAHLDGSLEPRQALLEDC